MDSHTAIVLDRHPLWLDAIEEVLHRLSVEVLAKTTDVDEALALVEELRPDVLILEPHMNELEPSNVSVIRDAIERHRDLKVIVLSSSPETADIDAGFDAGAAVYVFKTARAEDIASAIRQSFEVSMFLAPPGRSPSFAAASGLAGARGESATLTQRESEVLKLVAEGASNGEVARTLWVTEQTVKFHLSNIYKKIDVANRTEASRWAQAEGLLSPPPATDIAV